MRTINKITQVLIIIFLPLALLAQPELEEAPLFGTTKSLDLDRNSPKTISIIVKNKGTYNLQIQRIEFPEFVTVSFDKTNIAVKDSAILTVIIEPTVINKDTFSATIKLISTEDKPNLKTTYESTFEIKGSFD
jgi:hypothetical protein